MKFNVIFAALGAVMVSHTALADQFNNLGIEYGIGGNHQQGTVEFNKTVLPHVYLGAKAGYNDYRQGSNGHEDSLGVHVGGFMPLGNQGLQLYGETGYTSVTNHGRALTQNGRDINFIHTELGLTGPLDPNMFYKVYGSDNFNISDHKKVNYRTTFGGEIGYMVISDLSVNLGLKHQNTVYSGNVSSDNDDMAYLKAQYMF